MRAILAAMMALVWLLAVASAARADDTAVCGDPAPGDTQDNVAIYLHRSGDPVVVGNDGKYPGAVIGFAGCLVYAPPQNDTTQHYYTGGVTIAYFDKHGKYLGSNGQPLQDAAGSRLPTGAKFPHNFGASIGIGYTLKDATEVSRSVLVEVTIYDCPTQSYCAPFPHSSLFWLNTDGHEDFAANDGSMRKRNCLNPTPAAAPENAGSTQPGGSDLDPFDDLFSLYAEGLLRVSDDPSTAANPLTHLGIVACLRLAPRQKTAPQLYSAQALAYFFDKYGRVLGLGVMPLAIGGQQLDLIQAPEPQILHNGPISPVPAIHDFGVTVNAPLHNRGDIDRHVLIAVTITCIQANGQGCGQPPRTYYRIVNTCAPDLPDDDAVKLDQCPGYTVPKL